MVSLLSFFIVLFILIFTDVLQGILMDEGGWVRRSFLGHKLNHWLQKGVHDSLQIVADLSFLALHRFILEIVKL